MKFELDEDTVLRLNGAAMVALGGSVLVCPRAHADAAFTPVRRRRGGPASRAMLLLLCQKP